MEFVYIYHYNALLLPPVVHEMEIYGDMPVRRDLSVNGRENVKENFTVKQRTEPLEPLCNSTVKSRFSVRKRGDC